MNAITKDRAQGFACYVLKSPTAEVRVVPAIGAKITHLTNLVTGREWLWSPPEGARLFRSPTGTPFAEGTKWGADECLPTIAACAWRGRSLPDHGEAWTEEWTPDEAALAQGILTTRLDLPVSPLSIERSLVLRDSRLSFSYALKNTGPEPYEYVWALHPMFTIQPGDRLHLPRSVGPVVTNLSINCPPLGQLGDTWNWPHPKPGMSIDAYEFNAPDAAVKFFTPRLDEGRAAIENSRTGDFLRVTFDPAQLDTLGIWINRGGWNGYHHVAIEPTNGAPDALDVAVREWKRCAVLQPGETRRWEIAIEIGNRPSGEAR